MYIILVLVDIGQPSFIWMNREVLSRKNFLNFSLLVLTKGDLLRFLVLCLEMFMLYKLSVLAATNRRSDINLCFFIFSHDFKAYN